MNWLSEPVLTSVINISLPCLVFRMKNQSLVKACSPSSAGREVVNSLVTGLIDMVMDKVAAKTDSEKVVRKANIVQRKSMEMNARGKDEIVSKVRESVEKVKAAGSKSFIPKWVEEPKLPSGWKSCAGYNCDQNFKVCNLSIQSLENLLYITLPVATCSRAGLR